MSSYSSLSSSSTSCSSSSALDSSTGSFLSASICNRRKARRPIRGQPLFGIDEGNNGDSDDNCDPQTRTGTIKGHSNGNLQLDYYHPLLKKRLYIPALDKNGTSTIKNGVHKANNTTYTPPNPEVEVERTKNSSLSDLQKAVLIDCLSNHFLFGQLPPHQLESLVMDDMEKCIFTNHEIIVRQARRRVTDDDDDVDDDAGRGEGTYDDNSINDDVAEYFYILFSGDLRITQDGKVVGPDGDYARDGDRGKGNGNGVENSSSNVRYTVFGDLAVLTSTSYPVTVQAMSPSCTLFRLGRRAFHRALIPPSSEVASTVQERLSLLKQDLPPELAAHLLDHPEILNKLVSHLSVHSFRQGETLVDKNQLLDSLVIISEGKVVATEISLGGRSEYEDLLIGPGESRISFGWQSIIGSSMGSSTKNSKGGRRVIAPTRSANTALFHGTIVAKTDGTALLLSKEDFRNSISVAVAGDGVDDDDDRRTSIKSMLSVLAARRLARIQLQEIPIFKDSALDDIQIKGLLDLMHRCEYDVMSNQDRDNDDELEWTEEIGNGVSSSCNHENMTIFKVGDKVEAAMYFVREGCVTLLMDKGRTQQKIETGGYFGEKNLLLDQNKDNSKHYVSRSTMTAIAHSPRTVLDVLYLEECRVVVDTRRLGLGTVPTATTAIDAPIQWSRLKRLKLLGKGTFGQVWLASSSPPSPALEDQNKSLSASINEGADTTETAKLTFTSDDGGPRGTLVALKVHSKYRLVQSGYASRMVAERNILASLNSPFTLRLLSSFQDDSRLYMVTSVIEGGELESILSNDGLPETAARFYSASVLEALTYMHRKHIIHRDIKTSNIMIKSNGYPVLIDFGFAKYVSDKTFTFCGSPMYMAPEVIRYQGHDKGCDHWSWGVLSYRIVTGRFPFYERGANELALYRRICRGTFEVDGSMSLDFRALMVNILYPEPTKRLGCRVNGWRDIYASPWFTRDESFDVRLLRRQELPAPWVPVMNSNTLDPSKVRFNTTSLSLSEAEDVMNDESYPPLTDEQQLVFASFGRGVDGPVFLEQ